MYTYLIFVVINMHQNIFFMRNLFKFYIYFQLQYSEISCACHISIHPYTYTDIRDVFKK